MPTCPHCGHDTDPSHAECPLCGTPMAEGPGAAGGEAPGPSARAAGTEKGAGAGPVPWEDPRLAFPADLWRTWTESLFSPAAFFRRVSDEGTITRSLLYYLLVTVAGALFTLVWQSVWVSVTELDTYLGVGESAAAGPVVSFFLTPFVALVALVMITLVYHLAALVLAPERQGLGATARVVCYAAGPSVLAAVPAVGSLVGAVWSLVLQVVGLRVVHGTTTGRALLMVGWIWILFFLFTLGLVVLATFLGSPVGDPGPVVLGGTSGPPV